MPLARVVLEEVFVGCFQFFKDGFDLAVFLDEVPIKRVEILRVSNFRERFFSNDDNTCAARGFSITANPVAVLLFMESVSENVICFLETEYIIILLTQLFQHNLTFFIPV